MRTIKEVAEMYHTTAYTIRFYEKQGLLKVPRNAKGIRDFDTDSMDRVKAIVHYRNVGMSLEDIRQIFENFDDHAFSLKQLEKTKIDLDDKIAELEGTREYLIYKIALHRSLLEMENKEKD